MMRLHLFGVCILLLNLSSSVANEDLFSEDDHTNDDSVDELSFGPLPLEGSGSIASQANLFGYESDLTPNTDLWGLSNDLPISFETSGDEETGTALFAAGCPAGDKLGARDAQTSCPNPDAEPMHIPTLEELLDTVQENQDDRVCFPPRPFHLCCICGGWTTFKLCDSCTPYFAFAGCYAPFVEVCCRTKGVYWRRPGWTNLDDWTDGEETLEEYRASGSSIAEDCVEVPF